MTPEPDTHPSLDALARLARAGDPQAESRLLTDLRVRFLALAKRRLREDEVEDVVQDSLQIVHRKLPEQSDGSRVLPWSLLVLRNVIGNVYQARTRRPSDEFHEDLHPHPESTTDPLAGLEAEQLRQQLAAAIGRLGDRHPRCAAMFRRILESLDEGGSDREISQRTLERLREEEPQMTVNHFHVTLHRCRSRLRQTLESGGAG